MDNNVSYKNIINEHIEEILKMYFDGYSVANAIQEVKSHDGINAEIK